MILSLRALNRATLARQWLMQRSANGAIEAIEHLVGMQAQTPLAPYYGLWSRLDGFTGEELSALLTDRKAVRVVLMRGTIHLVTAADCHRLRPLVQPMLERSLQMNTTYRDALAGVDLGHVADAAEKLLAAEALAARDLGTRLAQHWPNCAPDPLAAAARTMLPLVQVPPRALWQRSGQVRLITATAWLGRSRVKPATIDKLVLRYLGSFGPATVADAQTWSGLNRLSEVFDRLARRLVRFGNARGQTLYDLPDAPRPDAEEPAPVRLVAPFDNILLSHADRTRVISDEHRKRLFAGRNGVFPGTLLVDGFVAGTWELEGKGPDTSMRVRPYVKLEVTGDILAEGKRLLDLAFGISEPIVEIVA